MSANWASRRVACFTAVCTAVLAGTLAAEEKKVAPAAAQVAAPAKSKPAESSGGLLSWLLGIDDKAAEPKPANFPGATHEKFKAVKVSGKEVTGTLQTLCTDNTGRVLAIVGKGRYDEGNGWGGLGKKSPTQSEIQVFDSNGKFEFSWVVEFKASAIGVGSNGDIFVAGDGMVAKCKSDGKIVAQTEAPHLAKMMSDKGKLRTLAEQRKKQTIDSYANMLKQFEKQAEARKLKSKDKTKAEDEEPAFGGNEQMLKTYRQMVDQATKKTIEKYMEEIGGQIKSVNSVAASDKEVFLTCGEAKGYGYTVWRMNYDLTDAKAVKEGLSGCCGQMDVQCCKDQLVIAENTRHRVGVYDRDGKQKRTFGSNSREGEGAGFGGCCNPMNTRPCANGDILTAESEGFIKRFDAQGNYVGLIAHTPLSGGCKNVAVAATPDLSKIYFCDQPGSQILILAKKSDKPAVAARAN